MEIATFAAGCFWGIQEAFDSLDGVKKTIVGYTGGQTKNPHYGPICSDKTGHAEAVQVFFDPKKISYEQLLQTFWKIHDPTQKNRQGFDIGSQYRSAIFYHTKQQKKLAEFSKEQKELEIGKKVQTEISSAQEFYPAEDYHQNYLKKQGLRSCRF